MAVKGRWPLWQIWMYLAPKTYHCQACTPHGNHRVGECLCQGRVGDGYSWHQAEVPDRQPLYWRKLYRTCKLCTQPLQCRPRKAGRQTQISPFGPTVCRSKQIKKKEVDELANYTLTILQWKHNIFTEQIRWQYWRRTEKYNSLV
jgi:hypothetical protein